MLDEDEAGKVLDNIPLPTKVKNGQYGNGTRKAKYPWTGLEVGQSFRLHAEDTDPGSIKRMRTLMGNYVFRFKRSGTPRTFFLGQGDDGVWYVWRTA